jgi:phosphotransferase system HPr-like phosphotransfer protein
MLPFKIYLKSINDVKEFVRIVNNYPCEVDLASGRYVVDAKSIMGIFSLDLTSPISVKIHGDDCPGLVDQLQPFTI